MEREALGKIIKAHDVCCPICGQKASFELHANGYHTVACHEALHELVEQNEAVLFPPDSPMPSPSSAQTKQSKVKVSITYGKKE